ncbi:hypothetical protein MPTK2_1g11970 [Marchantia polymorpha subsp. ruderalis]
MSLPVSPHTSGAMEPVISTRTNRGCHLDLPNWRKRCLSEGRKEVVQVLMFRDQIRASDWLSAVFPGCDLTRDPTRSALTLLESRQSSNGTEGRTECPSLDISHVHFCLLSQPPAVLKFGNFGFEGFRDCITNHVDNKNTRADYCS